MLRPRNGNSGVSFNDTLLNFGLMGFTWYTWYMEIRTYKKVCKL